MQNITQYTETVSENFESYNYLRPGSSGLVQSLLHIPGFHLEHQKPVY